MLRSAPMDGTGGTDWLEALTTPNADVGVVGTIIAARRLHVSTGLDRLADDWSRPDATVRRVLLVAHAGDGKTEFLRKLPAGACWFDDVHGVPAWPSSDRWVLNDPSQLPTERVVEFLRAAFGGDDGPTRFLAGINRGLLRAIVATLGAAEPARPWLERCLREDAGVHDVDPHGRVCVPLDRRVLVPAHTAASEGASAAGRLAHRVFAEVAREHPSARWDAARWARDVARVLALVEASGHHVTFREVVGLAAAVGLDLRHDLASEQPEEALATLFAAQGSRGAGVPSLTALRRVLVRLDPARASSPALDIKHHTAAARDQEVRAAWIDQLAGPTHPEAMFLRLCGSVPKETTDAAREDAAEIVRTALSRLAWGRDPRTTEPGLLPLTTSVHPGTVRGGMKALRGVLDLTRARIESRAESAGRYVEAGMRCPALVIDTPSKGGDPPHGAPRLQLDLELFQVLRRAATRATVDRATLGPRIAQVDAWFDALAADWAGELRASPPEGMVTVQSFLGAGDPIALRPSGQGAAVAWEPTVTTPAFASATAAMDALFSDAKQSPRVLLTPAACASALLRWAGLIPQPPTGVGVPAQAQRDTVRDASGAPRVAKVGRYRADLTSALYPWSVHTLSMAFRGDGLGHGGVWSNVSPTLGATLARHLGLEEVEADWRGALRAAWRADEGDFDQHPSGRLVHQWLRRGVDGLQLASVEGRAVPRRPASLRQRVVFDLLSDGVPFPRTHRWWLLGTWAAWVLFLDATGESRGVQAPVLLPLVRDARKGSAGVAAYESVRDAWWKGDQRRDSVVLAGQAAGFLQPAQAITHVDLLMDGPLLDVLQIVAHSVDRDGEERPERRTVRALEGALLEAGLYLQPPGEDVQHRVPARTMTLEAPASPAFGELLRAALLRLGMLDAASDGVTLFRPPWRGVAER
jgi:hypothetical protein